MATRATDGAAQAQQDDPERRARAREMIRILDAWLADESGYDEETWPQLQESLEQRSISLRKPFSNE